MKPYLYIAIGIAIHITTNAYSSEQRIFTYLEPSCSTPTAHVFYKDKATVEALAKPDPYKPQFSVSADQAISSVRLFLKEKYPDGYDFKVFQCTLGWHGMIKNGALFGLEYVFVRSEIIIPQEGPDQIIPCYNLVLPDNTVISGQLVPES